ncbi:hypothetical protein ACGFZQ_11695 [Streptomyces sp. NPDC048254]|uniref:hypothetical protein n=1 Tax=Streptomyces sp. NPDC048254 TaxID=3365525 RepID=UPI0037111130
MRADTTSDRAVGFLLDLIDSGDADRVRACVGLPRAAPEDRAVLDGVPFVARAVLAQLLGTFHGTGEELVATAGAVA